MLKKLALALLFLFALAPAYAASPPPAVPGLPDTERRTTYTISGTKCACSVGFALYGDSTDIDQWVQVWINGVRRLSTDSTYGWKITSPTGPLATIPRPITDAVLTFNSNQTATVQIVGARRPRRTTQFLENRGVAARDFNQALTDIIAMLREQWDETSRGLFYPPGTTAGLMPPAANCQNAILGFDGTGANPACLAPNTAPGTIIGPNVSTGNDIVLWNSSNGSQVKDGGTALPNGFTATTQAITDSSAKVETTAGAWAKVPGLNVLEEGADPTHTNASQSAFNAAFTAVGSGGSVIIPCGNYKITGAMSLTVASGAAVNINGQGRDCVTLDVTTGSTFTITIPDGTAIVNVSGITFLTGTASSSSIAMLVTSAATGNLALQPQKTFRDIACRGDDGLAVTNYWGYCIEISGGLNQVNIEDLHVVGDSTQLHGVGVYFFGTAPSFPEAINVTQSTFLSMSIGLKYGNFMQGLVSRDNQFTAVNSCINVPAAESGLTGLTMEGGECEATNAGIAVFFGSNVTAPVLQGVYFILHANESAVTGTPISGTFIGNQVACTSQTGSAGFSFNSGATLNMVTGNNIGGCNTGVWAQAGSSNGNIQSNKYSTNSTDVLVDVAATGWTCGQTTTHCTAGSTN